MAVDIDCVVIGAGVVGLAITRALALSGREVLLIEGAEGIGTGISSRNSEVIHAGIYYPADSLKARLCVQGKRMLYQYCSEHGIPHQRLGKLIVAATAQQAAQLDTITARAHGNGVADLERMTRNEVLDLEPALDCVAALLSPSTGIVDSHALMIALQGDAENAGAQCVFHTPFLSGEVRKGGGFTLHFGGDPGTSLSCNSLVNTAGLRAPHVAQSILGIPAATIPQPYFCKGTYFALKGRAPFSHLIYPIPGKDGLGVHLTLDLGGQAKFGPDTEWVLHEDYNVDPARAQDFYAAIRTYWPDLPDDALLAAYTGIRPKISAPDQSAVDFIIAGPREHGVPGLLNLFGIESPGLTASLAIAEHAKAMLFQ